MKPKISAGQFISTWMSVYEGNECWMDHDTIVENVAIELNVSEDFVRELVKKWNECSDKTLPGG